MCDDADHHTYESFMEAWVSPQVVGAYNISYVTTAPPPHYKRLPCMMVKLMHHSRVNTGPSKAKFWPPKLTHTLVDAMALLI